MELFLFVVAVTISACACVSHASQAVVNVTKAVNSVMDVVRRLNRGRRRRKKMVRRKR